MKRLLAVFSSRALLFVASQAYCATMDDLFHLMESNLDGKANADETLVGLLAIGQDETPESNVRSGAYTSRAEICRRLGKIKDARAEITKSLSFPQNHVRAYRILPM